ncbi:MAG: hypothetical protein ACRYHA_34320, partial [Janthinobacterium lividum]
MSLINYITQIQFDHGAVRLLASESERIGMRRPLIVTDRGVRDAGIIDTVLAVLGGAADMPVADMPVADMPVADMPVADMPVADVPVFDRTPPNPTEAAVRDAVAM